MPGRTKVTNEREAEEKALDLMFEADAARAWVMELRTRAEFGVARAQRLGLVDLAAQLADMQCDLEVALGGLEFFEERVTEYCPQATEARRASRKRRGGT